MIVSVNSVRFLKAVAASSGDPFYKAGEEYYRITAASDHFQKQGCQLAGLLFLFKYTLFKLL